MLQKIAEILAQFYNWWMRYAVAGQVDWPGLTIYLLMVGPCVVSTIYYLERGLDSIRVNENIRPEGLDSIRVNENIRPEGLDSIRVNENIRPEALRFVIMIAFRINAAISFVFSTLLLARYTGRNLIAGLLIAVAIFSVPYVLRLYFKHKAKKVALRC